MPCVNFLNWMLGLDYVSVGWVSCCQSKGCQFHSLSGHMPGLWVWSPVGAHLRDIWSMLLLHIDVSPSLSPSLPPSLKINKICKKLPTSKRVMLGYTGHSRVHTFFCVDGMLCIFKRNTLSHTRLYCVNNVLVSVIGVSWPAATAREQALRIRPLWCHSASCTFYAQIHPL